MQEWTIQTGIPVDQIDRAAKLYWQAFEGKLGRLMGPADRAHGFFREVMEPQYALSAVDENGTLIGLAGYKTSAGSMVGGNLSDLARSYGWFGALWRGLLLSALERDIEDGVLLMDGICVAPEGRGRGVGTALLSAIKQQAVDQGAKAVRLDVIDTNPRARRLYEREGFVAVGESQTGPLKWVFGFSKATGLRFQIGQAP